MKTKLKDLVLYSLACIGVVSLFISATTQPQVTSTPESHVWEMHSTSHNNSSFMFAINKKTGDVRKYETKYTGMGDTTFGAYEVAVQDY